MKKPILILTLAAASLLAGNLHAQLLGPEPETLAQRQARIIVESVERSKAAILGELRHNFRLLWDSPDPQAVLDALGPRAGKLFGINTRLTQYVLTELTLANDTAAIAEVNALLARIPSHVVNEDGTVTILPPEEPESTPEE
jgi:hypothetical protein